MDWKGRGNQVSRLCLHAKTTLLNAPKRQSFIFCFILRFAAPPLLTRFDPFPCISDGLEGSKTPRFLSIFACQTNQSPNPHPPLHLTLLLQTPDHPAKRGQRPLTVRPAERKSGLSLQDPPAPPPVGQWHSAHLSLRRAKQRA